MGEVGVCVGVGGVCGCVCVWGGGGCMEVEGVCLCVWGGGGCVCVEVEGVCVCVEVEVERVCVCSPRLWWGLFLPELSSCCF